MSENERECAVCAALELIEKDLGKHFSDADKETAHRALHWTTLWTSMFVHIGIVSEPVGLQLSVRGLDRFLQETPVGKDNPVTVEKAKVAVVLFGMLGRSLTEANIEGVTYTTFDIEQFPEILARQREMLDSEDGPAKIERAMARLRDREQVEAMRAAAGSN